MTVVPHEIKLLRLIAGKYNVYRRRDGVTSGHTPPRGYQFQQARCWAQARQQRFRHQPRTSQNSPAPD